jgi:hypothetical protein
MLIALIIFAATLLIRCAGIPSQRYQRMKTQDPKREIWQIKAKLRSLFIFLGMAGGRDGLQEHLWV